MSVDVFDALDISIHALREESDIYNESHRAELNEFQSTLSVRRATNSDMSKIDKQLFQSTLSVRRATVSGVVCKY